jgi:serine/threonine protein kinase
MECLDDLTVTNLIADALPGERRAEAFAHIDQCRSCYELVVHVVRARSPERAADERDRLAPGTVVGRYVIERAVGAGAMGVVYAARDPRLGRLVALKLVAASADRTTTDRMVREAQAMAQLSHPNVIAIFDVGTFSDDVFLAMEYLPGHTLRRWLAERGRTPRDIVTALVAAGRGLAAAHAVGIVHRDFKPENILVSERGRVCVTDFGLARAIDDGARASGAAEGPAVDLRSPLAEGGDPDGAAGGAGGLPRGPSASAGGGDPAGFAGGAGVLPRGIALTQTGQLIGTPVYMAPEQLAGAPADARSDQFAFCVVLYESLYGERPFAGRTLADLRAAIARGVPADQRDRRVAPRLRRILARGLASDPAARFPSMDALLAVLARDPATPRRWAAALGAIAVAVVAVGFAVPRSSEPPELCPAPRDRLVGVWDDARRARMRSAFLARARPYAAAMFERAAAALDGYANDWVAMRVDVCRATYVRRDQSEARYDAELTCLDRRRGELGAAVDVLVAAPDDQTVQKAVAVAQGLTSLAPCRDGAVLSAMTPMPADPAMRAQVDALYQGLATARALARVAKYKAAHERVRELVARARGVGFGPALADLLFLLGKLQMFIRDEATAEHALAAKDDALVARSWIQLMYTVGMIARRFPEAESLSRVARTAIQRAGDPAPLVIEWHIGNGAIRVEQDRLDDALPHFRDALAIAERTFAPNSRDVSDPLAKLATVLAAAGHTGEARASSERALALIETNLGPDHPDLVLPLVALGGLLHDLGDYPAARQRYQRALAILDRIGEAQTYQATEALEGLGNTALALGAIDEARQYHERVLAIRVAAGGDDDPRTGDSHINLGMALESQGKTGEARRHYDRALVVFRAAYGQDHPTVAVALRHLGELEYGTRDAVRDTEAALAITIKALGPDHPDVGVGLGNAAAAYAGVARWPEAQDRYERAAAHHEKTLGAAHWMTGIALAGVGECLLERGQSQRAIPVLERALGVLQTAHALPGTLGAPHYHLARALWSTGSDRKRATQLALQSKVELAAERDPRSVKLRTALDRWLAKHR